jgi:hypothetical protein
VLIALAIVQDMPTFGLDQLVKSAWRGAQIVDDAGRRLVAQFPTELEVIWFQEEAVERQLRDAFREAIEVVSPGRALSAPVAGHCAQSASL